MHELEKLVKGSWTMRGVTKCTELSGRGPIFNIEILRNATAIGNLASREVENPSILFELHCQLWQKYMIMDIVLDCHLRL